MIRVGSRVRTHGWRRGPEQPIDYYFHMFATENCTHYVGRFYCTDSALVVEISSGGGVARVLTNRGHVGWISIPNLDEVWT